MSLKDHLIELVTAEGQLDASRISQKEVIYTARSGKHVERFRYRGVSYIFKPCAATATSREQWAQQCLIPSIQGVKVPLLLASGGTQDPTLDWIIYEDLGSLIHCNHTDDIIRAAAIIPSWHRLPTASVPVGVMGHSPDYAQVLKNITIKKQHVNARLEGMGVSPSAISSWWAQLTDWEQFLQDHQAVSHGDYYRLNIAFQNQETIVLDWEFAHVNSVYWDLYSLMDITSHRYSRIHLDHTDREAALHQYWMSRGSLIHVEHYNDFVKGYSVFASVYSVWILTLIEADLQQSTVAVDALRRQQQETELVLEQCLQGLNVKDAN
jgi:aminoglycoside/choline kinase family phosphotransferase